MRERRRLIAAMAALVCVACAVVVPAASGHRGKPRHKDAPSRVLIIMLDQARPDTIERFDMDNVEELAEDGVNFKNGLVGHMAAETVVSHNVITSGQFPKNMGWSNEVHRDVDGLLGTAGDYYVTSSMSCLEFEKLIQAGGYKKLPDYLDARFGESSKFISIAQKRTSVCPAGLTSSAADGTVNDPEDIIFQIRGGGAPQSCDTRSGWRVPEDYLGSVPAYFGLADPCNRWWTWQGSPAYGTGSILPGRIYPLEGNRFVPGYDPAHYGGDIWSADAAIELIENDTTWHGMLVSLGGIDKLGHMWGPEDETTGPPGTDAEMRSLPFAAKNADEQVGKLMEALEDEGIRDETLVVITADHAAQTGRRFHGRFDTFPPNTPDANGCDPATGSTGLRSDCNWYFGRDANEIYEDPSPAIAALRDALAGNLRFSYQDGHVAAWLNDTSRAKRIEAAEAMLDLPDAIATYRLNSDEDDYRLVGTNHIPRSERSWYRSHADDLIDTMAAPYGPDAVALLKTDVTYGVMGDHGGHQELVQKIPMIFSWPGLKSSEPRTELRLVDVLPTVLETMKIRYDKRDIDGRAVKLKLR